MSSTDEPFRPDPPKWFGGEPIVPPFGGKHDPFGPDDDPNPARCKSCGVPFVKHLGMTGTCARLIEVTAERDLLKNENDLLAKIIKSMESIINSNKD